MKTTTESACEHVDVLIVGAGISGIGAGHHLSANCPRKTFTILEARASIGGTWDLFRYPGIRSDSDMHTLGYSFRPWDESAALADGPSILDYVRQTAVEDRTDEKIRFNHRVRSAAWSSAEARWSVEAERTDTGETVRITCGFLFMCAGYYSYDEGYTPDFEGKESFQGPVVHPQHWPEDLDYAGKRAVVIGSGATAMTLVPALAETAGHVTMLQRSPSYVLALPQEDPLAKLVRRLLPSKLAYSVIRWKNVLLTMLFYQLSRRRPRVVKTMIRKGVEDQLPSGYDVKKHFRPRYNPWDQRMCIVPNGDLFVAIREGRVTMVTDEIEAFTERGLLLASGDELEADLIVTATGLNLQLLGGIRVSVDGVEIGLPERLSYKGMMLDDVPNMAQAVGYTNASWTLKCDLTCEYVCRLLSYMDEHGYDACTPRNRDPAVQREPMIDFTSGYVQRSIHKFPKQGSKPPWRLHQNYARDILMLRLGALDDGVMEFTAASLDRSATAA